MGATMHIMPRGDLIEHDAADECVCGPSVEGRPDEEGSYRWLVVHHSLDGREADERSE